CRVIGSSAAAGTRTNAWGEDAKPSLTPQYRMSDTPPVIRRNFDPRSVARSRCSGLRVEDFIRSFADSAEETALVVTDTWRFANPTDRSVRFLKLLGSRGAGGSRPLDQLLELGVDLVAPEVGAHECEHRACALELRPRAGGLPECAKRPTERESRLRHLAGEVELFEQSQRFCEGGAGSDRFLRRGSDGRLRQEQI